MITALFFVASLSSTSPQPSHQLSESFSERAPTSFRLAKGPAKKPVTTDKKKTDKPEKAVPENANSDPRNAAPAANDAAPAPGGEARRGMGRIEFDDRLIRGQTNKANAIYLFERRESALRSLLKKRTDFHEEIDETLE